MKGPLCGPGSKGSEGSACLWQAGSKGGGIALRAMSFVCRLTAAGKPLQPGFARWKYTPSAYGTSPRESVSRDFQVALLPYKSRSLATPEGEVLAMLCLEVLMRPKAERRANFPLRGKWCVSTKRGAFQAPARAVCLFSSGRSPVVWFSLRCCHKLTLTPLPSIHSPTTKWEGRWWRQPPKGTAADRQHKTLPSEPARSVGGTHRSVRQHMTDRTRAPQAPEPPCIREYRPSAV